MKSTLLILIGYITCSLKCEMNKTEAAEKTDNVEQLTDKDHKVDVESPEKPEDINATDAVAATTAAAAEDTTYTVNTTAEAAAVDTIYAVDTHARWYAVPVTTEPPEDVETTYTLDTTEAVDINTTYAVGQLRGVETTDTLYTTDAVDTTDAVYTNTTYAVEQLDNTEQPEHSETSDAVDTTYAEEQPEDVETTYAIDTTDAVDTTYAVDTTLDTRVRWYTVPVDTEQPEDVEKIEATKKQERQTDDTGPSKIKVEDALKILEKSKKKYTLESIALITKLEWLRSTFNITELMIDHKIDPNEDFDDLSNTENSLNSSNILRQRRVNDGFLHVKNAIMKISKFEPFVSSQIKKQQQMAKFEQANRYKANFIATHSDRDNLKKIYLEDSARVKVSSSPVYSSPVLDIGLSNYTPLNSILSNCHPAATSHPPQPTAAKIVAPVA